MPSSVPLVGAKAVEGAMEAAGEFRLLGALLVLAVLIYWTAERVLGEGDDPTLRYSKSSDTGSSSFLVSGFDAVLAVSAVGVVFLAPEIAAGDVVILGVFAAIALAHWIVEKEERE